MIVWKDNRNDTPDCFLSYSTTGIEGLSLGISFTDTTVTGPKLNPDIEFKNNIVHIVYNHNSLNSIEYVKGSLGPISSINEIKIDNKRTVNFDLLGRKSKIPFNKFIFK